MRGGVRLGRGGWYFRGKHCRILFCIFFFRWLLLLVGCGDVLILDEYLWCYLLFFNHVNIFSVRVFVQSS